MEQRVLNLFWRQRDIVTCFASRHFAASAAMANLVTGRSEHGG